MNSVTFTKVRGNTYLVQCIYPSNSDAKGCVFIISPGVEDDSLEGVEDIMGTISRDNTAGVLVQVPDIGCYSEVIAFPSGIDIIDSVAVSINISSSMPCTLDSTGNVHV